MRKISYELNRHLAKQATTLAVCWKIKTDDGNIQGFTSNVLDLSYDLGDGDGVVNYRAASGVAPSDIKATTGSSVDNNSILGIINSDDIKDVDLTVGFYDHAKVTQFLLNYNRPDMGHVILMKGYVGQITATTTHFEVELRSLNELLSQNIGKVCSPTCMVKQFGDSQCNVNGGDLSPYTFTGLVVDSFSDNRVLSSASMSALSKPDHYFAKGKLTWTSGSLTGRSFTVKDNVGTALDMMLSLPLRPMTGSTFTLIAGCDRLVGTCNTKFSNVANFRGFPQIPGGDAVLRIIPG